ncbi:MAG: dCMP deaminase family protein [Lentisphaerae bacterium]|nr:dCMP deaminase family protein [Lentisphaerota bacterium]
MLAKHPDEVHRLRQLYPGGFYLLGVYCDREWRERYLLEDRKVAPEEAGKLMERDEDAHLEWGQRTGAAFHLSDFFVHLTPHDGHLKHSVWRIVDLLFGHPYLTPTFDEYAMFMAFAAALRSADLSRQVGAVIAKDNELLSTGANDCPRYGGGLYWPQLDGTSGELVDAENGRDWKRGNDSNKVEQTRIVDEIAGALAGEGMDAAKCRDVLEKSAIRHLTEYGRVVHAEMEALLSCARNGIVTRGATLYCTTFPCHNCAKHIIAAGITRVVYIEPYPKSKAREFHADSMEMGFSGAADKVHFEPFVGVGPRRFFDLFSVELGDGYPLCRKDGTGATLQWDLPASSMRIPMAAVSYLDLESLAAGEFGASVDRAHSQDGLGKPQHAQPAARRRSRTKRVQ